ncbi:hypothetical protein MMMB2_4815 [Mycobacterium marinum MB2]|nr:hypothetical protein MMMB2_4815 [Mycobacterium marinum MB2]
MPTRGTSARPDDERAEDNRAQHPKDASGFTRHQLMVTALCQIDK